VLTKPIRNALRDTAHSRDRSLQAKKENPTHKNKERYRTHCFFSQSSKIQ
jgi:hypothetical protein